MIFKNEYRDPLKMNNYDIITLLEMPTCYHCQNEIELSGRVGREGICPSCGTDLHYPP